MGPRVMRRLPKYVQGFIDRHGKPRFYFRRPGFTRLPLPGLPWSPPLHPLVQAQVSGGLDCRLAPPCMGYGRPPVEGSPTWDAARP